MNTSNAVVIDANVLVSICSKELITYPIAEKAFISYAQVGFDFFAPNVIVSEVLFALCVKFQSGVLTQAEYDLAVRDFADIMQMISTPNDESLFIEQIVKIGVGYACKRTTDSIYVAFADELAKTRITELLTFDKGIKNQILNHAPTVGLNLLKTD